MRARAFGKSGGVGKRVRGAVRAVVAGDHQPRSDAGRHLCTMRPRTEVLTHRAVRWQDPALDAGRIAGCRRRESAPLPGSDELAMLELCSWSLVKTSVLV